jgi:hypothetical protein
MLGDFRQAAPLAEAMKTDPAIFAALLNRIAPHRGLPREITAPRKRVQKEAASTFGRDAQALEPTVLADLFERLSMLGAWVGQNKWSPRPDGSRVDVRLEPFPMRAIKWSSYRARLEATTTDGVVPVVHGDGKWVVATLHAEEPWQWGATKALGLSWPSRAHGKRDRNVQSEAQALAKIIGTLPQGVAIKDPDGQKFVEALQKLRQFRAGGVFPHGSEIKLLESMAQGWQIVRELLKGEDSDIARALLGHDGVMRAEGGNYVKDHHIFGVRQDLVEGDLGGGARALNSGVLLPWAIWNLGDPALAPRLEWLFPDPDEAARKKMLAEQHQAFNDTIAAYKANGFEVDQAYVDQLAAQYGIDPPKLLDKPPAPAPVPPAPAPPSENDEGDEGDEG